MHIISVPLTKRFWLKKNSNIKRNIYKGGKTSIEYIYKMPPEVIDP
jgi:hypothetical protein